MSSTPRSTPRPPLIQLKEVEHMITMIMVTKELVADVGMHTFFHGLADSNSDQVRKLLHQYKCAQDLRAILIQENKTLLRRHKGLQQDHEALVTEYNKLQCGDIDSELVISLKKNNPEMACACPHNRAHEAAVITFPFVLEIPADIPETSELLL
ncbi:hypothetical protein C8R44DRAFT_891882 [Mycena epipterygia]|nr:hypothetical protein C8R44DRAFT_891882 [Mycena epipterygia]